MEKVSSVIPASTKSNFDVKRLKRRLFSNAAIASVIRVYASSTPAGGVSEAGASSFGGIDSRSMP